MKILMINPSSLLPEAKREYILGIPYLVSSLKRYGYGDIQVLDYFNMPWSETESLTIRALEDFKPNVVLISAFTINRVAGWKSAILAKEWDPTTKVVMGGFHPSFMYHQILSHFPVDAVCIGEGDETIVELLDAYKANTSIKGVRGIAYKENGMILQTEKRPFIQDLDSIPFPSHEIYRDYLMKTKKGHIITSRGCPYGCQFCSTTEFWGRRWRARSSKNVGDEIEMLVRDYGVNYINFMDDDFTLNRKRTIEISKEIINRSLKINWICSTRVDAIDEEQLEWMVRSGCNHIALGIESGSSRILKTIGKRITVEQIENAFDLLKKYGLSRGSFLMVGNTGEDRDSINETIQLINKIKLDISSVAVTELYPGTQLYEMAKRKNFINDEYWLSEAPPPFYTAEHSAEKLQWWAFLIVLNAKKIQGPLETIKFLIQYVISKRRKIMKYIVKLLKNIFRIKEIPYTYKEY